MSAEARYFRVGAFVLAGLAAIVVGAVVLGGGGWGRDPILFETYFEESVQGLEVGSPVKVRGVTIGSVSNIGFVNDAYELRPGEEELEYGSYVRVVMELVPSGVEEAERGGDALRRRLAERIERGLRVRLTTQGITGVAFLQADYLDPDSYPVQTISWEPRHLYVPSAPSAFKTFTSAAERIFQRLEDTDIESVVNNLDGLIVNLDRKIGAIDTKQLGRELTQLIEEVRGTNARVRHTIEGSRYDFELALENLRVATENFRDLSETARSYPSYMILGQPPEKSGVGAR